MNIHRLLFPLVAICSLIAFGAACSSSSSPAPDGSQVDRGPGGDGLKADGPHGDGLVADLPQPDTLAPDKGPPKKMPIVRVFDGDDGAKLVICKDGLQFGSPLERIVGTSGNVVNGYVELTSLALTKFWVEVFTGQGCKNVVGESSKLKLTPQLDKAYTLYVNNAVGFGALRELSDDLTAPASGQTRLRIRNGISTTYDVCQGNSALAAKLGSSQSSPYLELAPGALDLTLREVASSGDCTGTVYRQLAFTTKLDTTHTLFLVAPGANSEPRAALCDDAVGGVAKMPSTCVTKILAP